MEWNGMECNGMEWNVRWNVYGINVNECVLSNGLNGIESNH